MAKSILFCAICGKKFIVKPHRENIAKFCSLKCYRSTSPLKGRHVNLTGKYGLLTILSHAENRKEHAYFLCRCDCGKEIVVAGYRMKNGTSKSCGCLSSPDLAGKKFGKLQVIKLGERRYCKQGTKLFWLCSCDCGRQLNVLGANLTHGKSKSCGCSNVNVSWKNQKRYKDMVGFKSGYLEVVKFTSVNHNRKALWECICHNCGEIKIEIGENLRQHKVTSCGCVVTFKPKYFHHNGRTYRSSYELLVSLIMEKCDIEFTYEPRCFRFELNGKRTKYTPDFYLPTLDLWIEVKGYFRNKSKQKFEWLTSHYKTLLIDQTNIKKLINKPISTFYAHWKACNYDPNFAITHLNNDYFTALINPSSF